MHTFSSLPILFPSAGAVAFLTWPFWVIWLLKASSERGKIVFFVRIGVCIGLLGLCIFPQNMEFISLLFLVAENLLPLFLFEILHWNKREAEFFPSGWGEILPLLVIFCALMGFLLHSALGIIIVVGAGTVLLAWWEGRQKMRALAAWEMVRTRLCGIIMASLGAGLLHIENFPHHESILETSFFKRIGLIFLIFGLIMMANLGKRIVFTPILGLLDTGLRFVSLFLLSRLFLYPFAHHVIFIAACVGFCMFLFQKARERAFLSLLTCFACFAASFGDETALFLSFMASLILDLLRLSFLLQDDYSQEHYENIISKSFLPIIFVISIMIMCHMDFVYSLLMILGLYFALRRIKFKNNFHYPFAFWLSNVFWSQIFILLLFILSFIGVLLLAWHPTLSWVP